MEGYAGREWKDKYMDGLVDRKMGVCLNRRVEDR